MNREVISFLQSLKQMDLSVEAQPSLNLGNEIKCHYRNNPDGTIRWIWPSSARNADFLKFYHSSGLKKGLLTTILRLIARIGCLKFFSQGQFSFYTDDKTAQIHKHSWNGRWAWFSGTIGPNRKTILWHNAKDRSAVFIKIPLNTISKNNVIKEAGELNSLNARGFKHIVLPQSKLLQQTCLSLSDISESTSRCNGFINLPFRAAKEWMEIGINELPLLQTRFYTETNKRIKEINLFNDDIRAPLIIVEKINQLWGSQHLNAMKFTFAHGDFTPWNVMVKNNELHIIDLELSEKQMPILYDLFHYVYQSNILIGNKGYKAIRHELDAIAASPDWHHFIKANQIDFARYEEFYLLHTVTYYLEIYHQQEQWHQQVHWLMQTWNEALSYHLSLKPYFSPRKLVLKDTGFRLKNEAYATLKWRYEAIESLPEDADIDICIAKEDAESLIRDLKRHVLVEGFNLKNRSFMKQLELILSDGSCIHLDFIHSIKWKSMVMMNAPEVYANSEKNKSGIKLASKKDDLNYINRFYKLNNKEVPEKYRQYFKQAHFNGESKIELLNVLKKSPNNSGFKGVCNKVNYLLDTGKNLFPRKGMIITFSGVDGAGKSTVIENIHYLVDKRLRKKVVILRHRPGLLPILSAIKYGKVAAEQKSAERLPRLGANQSAWSSLIRFSYYYLDYIIGQWYVYIRYVMQGYIVLYDRYYFDFINDSKRSNIRLSSTFTAWWYRFLVKPRLNFFLFADAETILNRKQELDQRTIKTLTQNYLTLFKKLANQTEKSLYIPVENIELTVTLEKIFSHIKMLNYEKIN